MKRTPVFLKRKRIAAAAGLLSVGGASALLLSLSAHAETPLADSKPAAPAASAAAATPTIDPEAKATLEQIATAYKGLKSYSGQIELSMVQGATTNTAKGNLSFALPNKARAITTDVATKVVRTALSDGTSRYVLTSAKPATYIKAETSSGINGVTQIIRDARASLSGILPLMIASPDPSALLLQSAVGLTKGADETVDGVPNDVLELTLGTPNGGPGTTVKFAAGKSDHLLRRIILHSGKPDAGMTMTETYLAVRANPPFPANTFAFTAPAGAKAVAEEKPVYFDPRLKAGAMPLPFAGTDLDGKTVSLEEYKGKVVLLDFWATWCGPCRAELPNVVSAYNKYHNQGFEIVGISLDHEGDRDKLVKFTSENQMPWRQIYDGKYWEAALAKAYGVRAIPFSLLIGKDGTIVAVNPRGAALDPAVSQALAK